MEHALSLPKFDRPPVIETVLGVQFASIPNFTAAHFGLFWKQCLDSSWTKVQDAPRLPDQFEKFGDELMWGIPMPMFATKLEPDRVQIIHKDDDKLIQIQNSRFLYNWRKRENPYHSFSETHPEFQKHLANFEQFLLDIGLEPTPYNQWEITYINHVPKGTLWESPSDWPGIFPGLFSRTAVQPDALSLESLSSMLRFEIRPRLGRVTIQAQHAKAEDQQEVLQIVLTARGPVRLDERRRDLFSGITIGHGALVRAFVDISSEAAISHWGLK
jgi:uncharacterized protein (TIGR04255 family)